MTAAEVREACGELAAWLPEAEARIAMSDTDGTVTRVQSSSKPPWNAQAANALFDALEGACQIEAQWRRDVTGRIASRRPPSATGGTLSAIVQLSYAIPEAEAKRVARMLMRLATHIMLLPAIDEAEQSLRVAAKCPYCAGEMMRVYPRSGRVTCLYAIAGCVDANGLPPTGLMGRSALDGTPCIAWSDGLVWLAS